MTKEEKYDSLQLLRLILTLEPKTSEFEIFFVFIS